VIAGLVLAGGAARRMGGADKLALPVDGVPMLDRVLAAARPLCGVLVAVGPERPTSVPGVRFAAEATPGGGPVPAIAAGLALVPTAEVVLVLAGDLPWLTPADLGLLLSCVSAGAAAAVGVDGDQRPVPLLVAYRRAVLAGRLVLLGPNLTGLPAHRLLPEDATVVALGARATANVNTPEDLLIARRGPTAGRPASPRHVPEQPRRE